MKLQIVSFGRISKYVDHLLVAARQVQEITEGKRDLDTCNKEDMDKLKSVV